MTDTPRSQHVWPAVGSLRARSCKSVSWKVSYQTATGIDVEISPDGIEIGGVGPRTQET
jgi:hypothetical protein